MYELPIETVLTPYRNMPLGELEYSEDKNGELRMIDDNILDEAEAIANQYASRKPAYINIPDADWAVASDETKNLLTHVQLFSKFLRDAYLKVVRQGDQERQLLLYQRILSRPYLSNIDPELYDESERIERETEFIVRAKLWIREVWELLCQ